MGKKGKEDKTFLLIKERYFHLDKNFNKLLGLCKTSEEKKNLKLDYETARSNYRKGLNLNFESNDGVLKELKKELERLEKRIGKDIKNIDNIQNVFKMISESVRVASAIIVVVMSFV